MRRVRFLRPKAPYNVGEVAGFAEGAAKRLIDAGYAVEDMPVAPVNRMMEAPAAAEAPARRRGRPRKTGDA